MHELYELKDKLMKELEEYGGGGDLSAGSLEIVDKLTHTIKNLCKIIESMDDEGSSFYPIDGAYEGAYEGGSNRRGSYRGESYRRRDSMGRYARNGYSRNNDMVDKLRGMMQDAPDERSRQELQKLIGKMENM